MGRPEGAGPRFSGFGGYGPVPDNDKMLSDQNPSPHYEDGNNNRGPGGHTEGPADIWIDAMVYPTRSYAGSDVEADRMDRTAWFIRTTLGNITGKKPGPEE